MDKPSYLTWLIAEENVILDNGEPIVCYRLDYVDDDVILDNWALHIRRHYISDEELSDSCKSLKLSEEEYWRQNGIPQRGARLGSTARSNVISEVLFSDLLEFVYGLEVPRYRQDNMSGKTVSEHGTDVIGYKFYHPDKTPDERDYLITVEVKAGLTQKSTDVIEKAVVDANKDEFRLAQSLDFMRRKLKRMDQLDAAKDVLRFQKKADIDYRLDKCAAGMSSLTEIRELEINGKKSKIIPEIVGDELRLKGDASIYYVHGKQLMQLAHKIYDRCVR